MNMMKKGVLSIMVILGLSMLLVACSQSASGEEKFNAGTYEGVSTGHGGEVIATVTLTEDEIASIDIAAEGETESIGEGASAQVIASIINSQSLAVDAVSGATTSSEAIIEAVTLALEEAGADIDALKDPANKIEVATEQQEDLDVDVVVIGSGGAGMAAAVEAKAAGKSVVILEKMPILGGNTNRATGGMNAAETSVQADLGIEDSKTVFYEDTMSGGKEINNPDLVQTLVDHASESVDWINGLGADLSDVVIFGGQSVPRTHRPADGSPVGPVVVEVLSNKLKKEEVQILLETTAVKLLEEDGEIKGVEATDKQNHSFTVLAKSVVLATGGFGANSEMVVEYNENFEGFSTTNHKGALGSGIKMAEAVGADLTDIAEIQAHPTTDPESGYMFTEAVRGDGGILINQEGQRFIDELETRDVVSKAILEKSDSVAFLVANDAMREKNASLAKYIEHGYGVEGDTFEDLAKAMHVDAKTLTQTMKQYASYVANGPDEAYGRDNLAEAFEEGKYYAIPVTPSVHHTMGGLRIDTKARVLNKDGAPIKGLYAAGEVTGGIHGANRLGGNAIADILTFGRIAGMTAASEIE